ncbi:phage replisome organizer N-terminal domain-containing protein [Lactococcus lactis]|uniref:phage replisome organizer N-terminal domain-containing protein n=1 Tax=Lactococcus lactis TaxID=1358 RepID=UPI002417C6F7|nr:phage replisome organizer N-terminal domain-containing protein [Lactococcus lactis]MDG4969920.1 phage replisome organizer N-terminal domain-containing protein [Lactococcus lactis]MDG5103778.1 phage replisome organizer N-terminal domain-containing protein [Lactococcus lactis]
MADKRYYWFKMEQSFFEQKEIKYLRRLPGGDTYTIIYLKLILKSLENDGKIYYENIGDDYSQEWALEIEEDEKAVSFLVAFLINKGLMIDCGFDEFEITKTKSLVGSETASAERKRRQRERERELLQFKDVTDSQKSVTLSQVGHIESEIESEIEIESDDDVGKNSLQSLSDFFSNNFHPISQRELEQLREFVNDSSYEMVRLALEIAVDNNARTIKYVRSIIVNWENNNIKTPENYHAFEAERKRKCASNSQNKFQQQKPVKKAPEWTDEGRLIKAGVDTTGMTQNEMYKLAGEMGLHNE